MKLNRFGQLDFEGPPLPDNWPIAVGEPSPSTPLTIDITGGREQTWWEANQAWALPAGFVLLFVLANR